MTFEGQYLTYSEYQTLGGSTIGEMPFNLLEYQARKEIDLRTNKRLVDLVEIPNDVKLCVKHLIDTILLYENKDINNRGIASESVGSYSVSYSNNVEEIIKGKNSEIADIIKKDLYGLIINDEHVLFRGVNYDDQY